MISPNQQEETVTEGVEAEHFLILTHPEMARLVQYKTAYYECFLVEMRKIRQKIASGISSTNLEQMHKLI